MTKRQQISWGRWATVVGSLVLLRGVAACASQVTSMATNEIRYQVFDAVNWIKDAA